MSKSTISMAIFDSNLLNYQRVHTDNMWFLSEKNSPNPRPKTLHRCSSTHQNICNRRFRLIPISFIDVLFIHARIYIYILYYICILYIYIHIIFNTTKYPLSLVGNHHNCMVTPHFLWRRRPEAERSAMPNWPGGIGLKRV